MTEKRDVLLLTWTFGHTVCSFCTPRLFWLCKSIMYPHAVQYTWVGVGNLINGGAKGQLSVYPPIPFRIFVRNIYPATYFPFLSSLCSVRPLSTVRINVFTPPPRGPHTTQHRRTLAVHWTYLSNKSLADSAIAPMCVVHAACLLVETSNYKLISLPLR